MSPPGKPQQIVTHHSHCDFHLGDQLIHLHFLRKLAQKYPGEKFIHAVHECHIPQLAEAVGDMPQIQIIPLPQRSAESIDTWKNAGGYWQNHPLKNDYSAFYVEFFKMFARRMGLESPIKERWDLLLDYPAIRKPVHGVFESMDVLVVNSQPCSGQARSYDRPEYFDPLIKRLTENKLNVVCTQKSEWAPCTRDFGLSISGVGGVSLYTPVIIMIATGPSWPTFNIWNRWKVALRIIMSDNEDLNLSQNTHRVRRLDEMFPICAAYGLI